MMDRPASMQQIADALGVSRVTVANALSGRGRVSAAMAARVREMAEALNFVPSHAGRTLRTGRSTIVGLVVPDFTMPLFAGFVQAFERAAKARGLALLIGDSMGSGEMQAEQLRDFAGRGADALIVIPLRGAPIDPASLPVPVAVVDSAANPLNTASADHREGGRIVARHLVALGHRHVEIVLSRQQSNVSDERGAGMREVFAAAGVTLREVAVGPDLDAVRAHADGWRAEGVTAICAAYDAIGVGMIAGLTARGIRVPQDVSVTGFDDIVWGRIVAPPLTTLRQDLPAIAEHALDVVTGRARGQRLAAVTLVVRGSTCPPSSPAKDLP
ncbi:LacI family DNA-binding transcriptional regulator [Frigidibacter sp. MR17.24]|uniref:LacI family DNA-binding transcriptional regulator n=1 Tax=Frigidibacter sp. MR17.24 TaxID=3127345 RepID=UPI00301308F3